MLVKSYQHKRLRGPMSALPAILVMALCATGCGGSGGGSASSPTASASPTSTPTTAAATTQLSDPANQCSGLYSHVFVTVSDVQASTSGAGGAGLVDLTPGLATHPIQVDLMAAPVNECFLAQLGINSGLPAGNYQQIRFILLANNASGVMLAGGAANQCGGNNGPWNCVVQTGSSTSSELSLPSEAQTGIKIPPGQIAGGGIVLTSGQSVDIDIDFNACSSVVEAGNSGKFLLKPTLRASEVGTDPLIAGTIVSATAAGGVVSPDLSVTVPNANVWLQQEPVAANFTVGSPGPAAGSTPSVAVERLIQTTTADSNGHFEFCPVGPGTYDVVADAPALPPSGLPSTATVATDVTVASGGGPNNLVVPLVAESVGIAANAWGQISAIVSTVNTSAPGDDVTLTGVQAFTPPGGDVPMQALIPLFYDLVGSDGSMPASVPPVVTTSRTFSDANCPALASVTSCPAGTNCACFNLAVPVGNPVVGAGNSTGGGYVAPAAAPPGYAIAAVASTAGGASSDLICAPPTLISNPAATFPVTPGAVTTPTNPVLQFAGCD